MTNVLENIAAGFWHTLSDMSPYLLFGFLVAGFLTLVVPPAMVERHLGGRGMWPVIKASIFGVPLPLCSCGVIPVAASLRRHGASRGATTAFLISTPETGIDSILVTYSLLGLLFAVFRPVAAFISGIIGGGLVDAFDPSAAHERYNGPRCEGACCSVEPHQSKVLAALRYGFLTLPGDIGKSLFAGIVVAALIAGIVPDDFLGPYLAKGSGLVGMLVMMALGIPMYVCASASVPIAAALILKGVSPGAALVFLMTGPATNAATVATVWKVMGRRTAFIYLMSIAGTALASGFILDYIFRVAGAVAEQVMPPMLPLYVQIPAVLGLVGVVVAGTWYTRAREAGEELVMTGACEISVEGMKCSHCAASIERALGECAGVESARVDLKNKKAYVTGRDLDVGALHNVVTGLGYKVKDEKHPQKPGTNNGRSRS